MSQLVLLIESPNAKPVQMDIKNNTETVTVKSADHVSIFSQEAGGLSLVDLHDSAIQFTRQGDDLSINLQNKTQTIILKDFFQAAENGAEPVTLELLVDHSAYQLNHSSADGGEVFFSLNKVVEHNDGNQASSVALEEDSVDFSEQDEEMFEAVSSVASVGSYVAPIEEINPTEEVVLADEGPKETVPVSEPEPESEASIDLTLDAAEINLEIGAETESSNNDVVNTDLQIEDVLEQATDIDINLPAEAGANIEVIVEPEAAIEPVEAEVTTETEPEVTAEPTEAEATIGLVQIDVPELAPTITLEVVP